MRLSQACKSSLWHIRFLVLLFYPLALCKVLWVRRSPGIHGIVRYPLSILQSILGVVVGFYLLRDRGFSVLSLHAFMRSVDDTIDGDWSLPRGMTLESYLEQKDQLFAAILDVENDIQLLREDIFLVSLIMEGQHVGIDLVPTFQKMWGWYRQDVDRQLKGELPAAFNEAECPATKANVEFFHVFFRLIGGDPSNNPWVVREAVTIFMMCDVLNDLVDDIRQGIAWIPQDSLEQHGFQLSDITQVESWDDLKSTPLATWYRDQAEQVAERWTQLKDKLHVLLRPLIPQKKLRALFIWAVSKQFNYVVGKCQLRSQSLA